MSPNVKTLNLLHIIMVCPFKTQNFVPLPCVNQNLPVCPVQADVLVKDVLSGWARKVVFCFYFELIFSTV